MQSIRGTLGSTTGQAAICGPEQEDMYGQDNIPTRVRIDDPFRAGAAGVPNRDPERPAELMDPTR